MAAMAMAMMMTVDESIVVIINHLLSALPGRKAERDPILGASSSLPRIMPAANHRKATKRALHTHARKPGPPNTASAQELNRSSRSPFSLIDMSRVSNQGCCPPRTGSLAGHARCNTGRALAGASTAGEGDCLLA
jgi:hypothetical protein